MNNSPFINKLRSNKNYKATEPIVKSQKRLIRNELQGNEFDNLIDQVCTSKAISIFEHEPENILDAFNLDDENNVQKNFFHMQLWQGNYAT
ncbi:unnamed protein product [Brachionus calyciflorus]|uniref:Uncharacterized protein n=1 Tax=Brachionus calyciflorus TaxID=104777 RepID=A0A813W0H1_9BILA|nr:unnamed protein product [Brachionus calyciflorus]